MKELTRLLGIALLLSLQLNVLHAQEHDLDVEVKEQMDRVFARIDKNKIETGLLFDYGCWLVDPCAYNGVLTADNLVTMEAWKMAYLCLYTSRINAKAVLKEPAQLFAGVNVNEPALLCMQYERLDEKAFDDGRLFVINEQLHETGSPGPALYQKQDLFAVALPERTYNPTVSFVFQKGNWISNLPEQPAQLSIRFTPGSAYRNITWGQPIAYTFPTGGEKEICIRAQYAGGKTLESHARIRVVSLKPTILEKEIEADETIEIAETGGHNGGKIQIKYALFNTKKEKLIRPLIIADESQMGEYFKESEKVNLNTLLNNGGTKEIMAEVNKLYDIVYVDNNDGFDDIFRNARLFEEAMQLINRKRDLLHDKSCVIGLGMGGLVARYALRDMERKGLDHGAGKYISLNTPHKGANIPVGLQALIRYVQNLKLAKIRIKDILGKVDSIGDLMYFKSMKQMMVYAMDNDFNYSNEHALFMQEYERMGMPVRCENVAMSNGNRRGYKVAWEGDLLYEKKDDWRGFKSRIYLLRHKEDFKFFSACIKLLRMEFRPKELSSTTDMVALDGAPGSSFSLSSVLSGGGGLLGGFKFDRFCFLPTVSALALNNWEDKLLYYKDINASVSCFDRVYSQEYENYDYANLAVCANDLYKELAPQIEGVKDRLTGETTLTVTNVPFSLPVTWSLSDDHFKIVSRSGSEVTVVPLVFNSSSRLTASISFSGINIPLVTVTIASDKIEILGDTYISRLENRYQLFELPENTTLGWRVADGLEIIQQSGPNIVVRATGKTTPWIEAIITTNKYNTETVIRKELKCVPLTGARLQYLDRWMGKNDKGEYVRKYAYRMVYEPAEIPLRQLEFCWGSTVEVTKGGNTSIPKRATLETDGSVAVAGMVACFDSEHMVVVTPPVINPGGVVTFSSLANDFELGPDIKPADWSNSTDHVTVWMPKINTGGESKGRIFCTVKDFLGNSFRVTSSEELFDKWESVYHVAPTPASTTLTLSKPTVKGRAAFDISASAEPLTINLYNDTGIVRSVASDTAQPEIQLNVADLPGGTYYLNVLQNGQVIHQGVVMVRHD